MTAPAIAAAAAAVHLTIPGFTALFEGAVDWRACSAVAIEVACAANERRAPSAANAKAIWNTMIAAGQVSRDKNTGAVTGADLAHIHWYLSQKAGYTHLDWMDYSATPNRDAIHAILKDAALCSQPTIVILTNGQAMPNNEAGVHGHFTAQGGIDSTEGYLTANGDTQTAISTGNVHPPLNWAGWDTLVAAGVAGIIRVYPKAGQPVIPRAWSDNNVTLKAPNGGTCGHGIRWEVLTTPGGWDAALEPVTGEVSDPVGVHQDFRTNGDALAAGVRLTWHESDESVTRSPLAAITPAPPPPPPPPPVEPPPPPPVTPPPVTPPPPPDYAAEIAALTAQLAHLATATQAASQAASNATEQATQAVAEAVAAAQAAASASTEAQTAQSDVASLRTALKAL